MVVTEEEAVRNLPALLDRAAAGEEVVIQRGDKQLHIVAGSPVRPRKASEVLAILNSRPEVIPDPDYAKDVLDGIQERSGPWEPPAWD